MDASIESQILETASRLFFTRGYAQTGINQLIIESGVAKRTFYRYFASKDALALAYLDRGAAHWLGGLGAAAQGKTAEAVLAGLFAFLERFATGTEFRGCGMLNMAAEFADAGSDVRSKVRSYKGQQREFVRAALAPHGVDAAVADGVHVLIEGAIAAAAAHLDLWPIRAARRAALELLHASARVPAHPAAARRG